MSEQQPPADAHGEPWGAGPGGTPEYLDYGSGAPIPPEGADGRPTAERSRRTTLLVGGGVVGLLALGAGAWAALSFFQQGAQPAQALPASTIAYASIDLDPSGGQKIDAFRTLEKFPAFKDKVGIHSVDDVRKKIGDELISGVGCPSLTFESDIDPWLGDRAAVAAVDLGGGNPEPVFVVQAKDDAKAEAGMHTLLTCGDNPPTDVAYDVHDGWVIVAKTQADVTAIEAATAKGSLADDATYQKWTKAVGDAGVVNLYAAPAAGDYLAGQLSDLSGAFSPFGTSGAVSSTIGSSTSLHATAAVPQEGSGPFGEVLKNFQGAAATIRFTGNGLEVATATDSSLTQPIVTNGQGGAAVTRLPADTAAALGVGLQSGWVLGLADRFASYSGDGQTGQDLLDQLSQETGLDLPADAETLLGTSSAISVGKSFDYESMVESSDGTGVPVAYSVKGDPAAIEKVLAKLRAQVGSGSAAALGSDSGAGVVVVGPSPDYRTQVLAGGDLGSTSAFTGVIPEADHANEVLYLNVDDLEHALSQASSGDRSLMDNVAPLQALGFSSWTDGSIARTSFKVSTD
ncbi:DUF3352 domain-containing protein [Nocardioides cynanchi]|uniref:DUF3352 domain-containing protein n=1 Tax=Nocardioides cynanchi TaxID=2558918 RepID=UPI0012485244|nr:DUF3352 domain-containing protein [Nocardioides cynanchi]